MPNWCEGTLKVRGKISDLKRFVLEGLQPVNKFGEEMDPFKFEAEDKKSFFLATGRGRSWIWIRDTRRHFCEADYIEAYADNDTTPTIMLLPMKAAWEMKAESLRGICKKFNVDKDFVYYGARGITVCKEWRNYDEFRKWASQSGYAPGLTIDRVDPNGNYCPKNCRWITIQEQQLNRHPKLDTKTR